MRGARGLPSCATSQAPHILCYTRPEECLVLQGGAWYYVGVAQDRGRDGPKQGAGKMAGAVQHDRC